MNKFGFAAEPSDGSDNAEVFVVEGRGNTGNKNEPDILLCVVAVEAFI